MNTRHPNSEPRLGIDIGRVIMAPVRAGQPDTSFLRGDFDQAMRTPPSPGAIDGVRRLVEMLDGRVWLVSKAGVNVENKTRAWLSRRDFYAETGLERDHLRFCRRRPEKADHCRALAITHFVDDRLDVLIHLRDAVPHLYLFGEQPRGARAPGWVTPVRDWPCTLAALLEDLVTATTP